MICIPFQISPTTQVENDPALQEMIKSLGVDPAAIAKDLRKDIAGLEKKKVGGASK